MNSSFITEIKTLIEQSQQDLAVTANSTMLMLYWNIGKRFIQEELQDKRAEYGKQIFAMLSRQLSWSHLLMERLHKAIKISQTNLSLH